MKPEPARIAERYLAADGRRAELRREAAIKDWLKWIVQPAQVIWKHHRDFVYGPIDDAIDEIIRDLAPRLVKIIGEREVDEDVDEFITGAQAGKWDADQGSFKDVPSGETEDFEEGYVWGYDNHETFNGRKLPGGIEREVVEDAIKTFRKRVTEEFVIDVLEKAWHAVNPAHTMKAIIRAVKKHGWKLGISFALFEVFEHAVLPAIAIWATGDPRWAVLGTLPIGEVVYAVIIRVLGRAPQEINEFAVDGHLDWYEAKFGPARLASCVRVATRKTVRA